MRIGSAQPAPKSGPSARARPGEPSPLVFEARQVTLRHEAPRLKASTVPQRHCILLHGWNSPSGYMDGIKNSLQALPAAAQWHFWLPEYKTHFKPFAASAAELAALFARQPYDFSHTVFVGFSMGGLVARQMVAGGFGCHALVSICSPHGGLAPWVPTHSPGTWSLSRRSSQLRTLNLDAVDRAHRNRYHFFAVTYRDRLGYHDDDTIVTARSALGANLGNVRERRKIRLEYGSEIGRKILGSPHARGMSPRILGPVFETCAELFRG